MAKYGINKAILVGNLGQDPELKFLDGGIAVCNFTMATSDRFKNRDGQIQERTEWHNIVLWRGLAETAGKYLKKGSTIYLEGRIVTRSWESDGVKKYKTEIEGDKMVMLDSAGAGLESTSHHSGTQTPANDGLKESASNTITEESDDLPF